MFNLANCCFFEGRISRDPQFSQVQMGVGQNGQPNMVDKALFSIAVDRALSSQQRQKAKNGDQSIKTVDFIPCSLIGAQVATLRQYFPKGKAIKGVGHYTEYQTTDQQTGQTKYGHIFEIDNIGFTIADSKNVQNGGGQSQNNNGGYQQNNGYNNQQSAQNFNQQPQNNFAMFDESESPF